MKFLLCLTSREFFPENLIGFARNEVVEALQKCNIESLIPPDSVLPCGAAETLEDGKRFAEFLHDHENEIDGVLLVLPNFGTELASAEALRNCRVPIYILAYPDELDKMDFAHRRDAFCGKLSIMDVFGQYGIHYTAWAPHTLSPYTPEFCKQMMQFAAVCRIVRKVRECQIGAIGARPAAFKTMRCDEVTLQKYGVSVDTLDNTDLFLIAEQYDSTSVEFIRKRTEILNYSNFSGVPEDRADSLTRLALSLEKIIRDNQFDAIAIRCWDDIQKRWNVSPCVLLSMLSDSALPAACELDIGNALSMLALQCASGNPATCLDWNNNYGDNLDQCILFHCGCVPKTMMAGQQSRIVDHPMFAKVLGDGIGYGCNAGRIAPSPFTFASFSTLDGKLFYYSGEAQFLDQELPHGFFGCGGVAEVPHLQTILRRIGQYGFRHHVSITFGKYARILDEALGNYLKYEKQEIAQ